MRTIPTLVTLSRFPDLFTRLAVSVETHEPGANKVVVVDGPDLDDTHGWQRVEGIEPFRFSRNANAGIRKASGDVVLINDDVTLSQPILSTLAEIAEASPQIGILAPQVVGPAKNRKQRFGYALEAEPCSVFEMVAFVCVYLRRAMIEAIGGLDERFTCSYEDDDYCATARHAGWDVAITGRVSVEHSGSESIKRVYGGYAPIVPENRRRFERKWAHAS